MIIENREIKIVQNTYSAMLWRSPQLHCTIVLLDYQLTKLNLLQISVRVCREQHFFKFFHFSTTFWQLNEIKHDQLKQMLLIKKLSDFLLWLRKTCKVFTIVNKV